MGYFGEEFKLMLYVRDYEPALFFYREVLGLAPNYTWSINGEDCGTRFYLGDGRLEVLNSPVPVYQGISACIAQTADADACFEYMGAWKDLEVVHPPAGDDAALCSFTVRDPAGNLLRVEQPHTPVQNMRGGMFGGQPTWLVATEDVPTTRAFYEKLLGLVPLAPGRTDIAVRYAVGGGFIALREDGSAGLGPCAVSLQARNVNACYNALAAQGAQMLTPIRDEFYGMRLFRLLDPGGNLVEIYAYLEDIRDELVKPGVEV